MGYNTANQLFNAQKHEFNSKMLDHHLQAITFFQFLKLVEEDPCHLP
jgi:hypothetical protein